MSHDTPERVDLSSLSLAADPAAREALIVSVLARYRRRSESRLDLWSALATYARRPVIALAMSSAVLASIISAVAVQEAPRQQPLIPSPIARWLASSSTPTPVEIMEALRELPR